MKVKTVYRPFPVVSLPDRQWPNRTLEHAPTWCSVDLRDGNQALAVPMNVTQKMRMFEMLVACGFKEIEVGFPSASDTEFEFIRKLIEEERIPADVTIQVLVQAREDLINRTIDSLIGAKKVIVHLYNSTSPAQREIVFGKEKAEIVAMAVKGTEWVKAGVERLVGTDVTFQYSPESFSATEVEFALEVCEAVIGVWQPTVKKKMIINLPNTVEVAMPNVYADQVEWFCRNVSCRDRIIVSIHTHNDRGTGVASTELGLLAGAERVEGTLFGNGERTGNLDIITVALNMYTQGIDPELDFTDLDTIQSVYESCTNMRVSPRHPYSGDLVFTAFSGSHQDAIRKGLEARARELKRGKNPEWNVPYLTINPIDLGRNVSVIRVNGQSGKGGVAYLLEQSFGISMPKAMEREFGVIAGKRIDALGREVTAEDIRSMFDTEYIERKYPYIIESFGSINGDHTCTCSVFLRNEDRKIHLEGEGNGPIDAFIKALQKTDGVNVTVVDYSEHSLEKGEESSAIAYICLEFPDGSRYWGAGIDTNIELASLYAVMSALNRKVVAE